MSANTLTATPTARPVAEPATTRRTPDRKIFFGTAGVLLTATAVGIALQLGGGTPDMATTGAAAPSAGAVSHVTPGHILQPR